MILQTERLMLRCWEEGEGVGCQSALADGP